MSDRPDTHRPPQSRVPAWSDGVFVVPERGPRETYAQFSDDFGLEYDELEMSRFVNAAPGMALGLGLMAVSVLTLPILLYAGVGICVIVAIRHGLFGRSLGSMANVARDVKGQAYRDGMRVDGELRKVQVLGDRKVRFSYRYRFDGREYLRSMEVRWPYRVGHPVQDDDHLIEAVLARALRGARVDVLVLPHSPELAALVYKSIRHPDQPRPELLPPAGGQPLASAAPKLEERV